MADAAKPFPPGDYPLVVVGSGPGALQLSYSLRRFGVEHAVVSADAGPGGMFRKWPFFQRMLSWTKPFAPADRHTRQYERYDWNSLLAGEEELRGLQTEFMDGTSYFPAREEMERGLTAFADRAGVHVRYGCRWEATRKDGEQFVLETSDGEYRAPLLVFAVGVAEPWRPDSPGLDLVPHYADMKNAEEYAGKSVFIVGKRNSGFEIATGLLPWAKRIVLASPSPAKTSVETKSLMGVRARYVQPFEDHDGGAIFALGRGQDEVIAVAPRRLPPTSVADLQMAALGKCHQAALHLGPGWEVRRPVHHRRHDGPVLRLVRQQAVPVVALVRRRAALLDGVRLGPAEHALEDRPAPEHASGRGVIADHRVLHAEAAKGVGQLERTRSAADEDQRISARRKRRFGQLNHLVVVRTLRASPCRSRYMTRGWDTRKASRSSPGRTRHRSRSWATMSATGGTPSRHEISPK